MNLALLRLSEHSATLNQGISLSAKRRQLLCFAGVRCTMGGIVFGGDRVANQSTRHRATNLGNVAIAVAESTVLAEGSRAADFEQGLMLSAQRLPDTQSQPAARHIDEAG